MSRSFWGALVAPRIIGIDLLKDPRIPDHVVMDELRKEGEVSVSLSTLQAALLAGDDVFAFAIYINDQRQFAVKIVP